MKKLCVVLVIAALFYVIVLAFGSLFHAQSVKPGSTSLLSILLFALFIVLFIDTATKQKRKELMWHVGLRQHYEHEEV